MSTMNKETEGTPAMSPPTEESAMTALGMNRKVMEQERLARLASRKRERAISPPRTSRKAPKIEEKTIELPSGARLSSFSTLVNQDQKNRKTDVANAAIVSMSAKGSTQAETVEQDEIQTSKPESLPPGAIKYPRGVVKKTWAFGHARTGNDIKLEEVLEPQTLKIAMLSAFQWDVEWVLSKLKIPLYGGSTKCIFVMQAKSEEEREQWRNEASYMKSFLRLCFPNMKGRIHCMHSKLMLLFHPDKLRIAIPTANLLNFDWGETGQMENSVFLVDLPRRTDGKLSRYEDLPAFGQELVYFLEQQGLDDDVRSGVLKFDFSATGDIAFVHTIGGTHFRDDAGRTGLMGLSKAVNDLKLAAEDLEIDFAASSIGNLKDNYLRDFYSAAKGIDLTAQAAAANAKAAASFFDKKASSAAVKPASIREKLRIYFPTSTTVQASTAGAAGTICIARQYYEDMGFPRACFRDYKSTRAGLLSHNKILLARGKGTHGKDIAWIYVGSSNMSQSAWGNLAADRRKKQITCMNWECGVILPVPQEMLQKAAMLSERTNGNAEVKEETADEMVKEDGEDSETESESEVSLAPARTVRDTAVMEKSGDQDSETESEASDTDAVPSAITASRAPTVPLDSGTVPSTGQVNVGLVGFDVFKTLVDVPFETPGEKYRDGQEPWYFKEQV